MSRKISEQITHRRCYDRCSANSWRHQNGDASLCGQLLRYVSGRCGCHHTLLSPSNRRRRRQMWLIICKYIVNGSHNSSPQVRRWLTRRTVAIRRHGCHNFSRNDRHKHATASPKVAQRTTFLISANFINSKIQEKYDIWNSQEKTRVLKMSQSGWNSYHKYPKIACQQL